MNILFISSTKSWGGGEVWLAQMCKGLTLKGHIITVVCRPNSKLAEKFDIPGVELITLRLSGDFNPISIFSLYSIIKSRNIDVVCTNTEKDLRLGGMAGLFAGVPVVISREVDQPIKNKWINKYFYNRIATALMVNSHATYNTMLNSAPWLKHQHVEIIWKGIDPDDYSLLPPLDLRKELQLEPDDCIVGFVGRLDEQKGVETLLEAIDLAVDINPHIKLIIAGEGNLNGVIETFIKKHHLEGHIFNTGFRKDIPGFLNAIDFLVMPSYWEGFGYSAVEAMAVGKPVIATFTSSFPEIIENGKTGLLVPPRSPKDLSGAIVKLSRDHALCQKMSKAGTVRVRELFQLSTMITKAESLFRNVINIYYPIHEDHIFVPWAGQEDITIGITHK